MQASYDSQQHEDYPIPADLGEALRQIRRQTGDSADIVVRPLQLDAEQVSAVYVEGLVDKHSLENTVLRPLLGGLLSAAEKALPGYGHKLEAIRLMLPAAGAVRNVGSLQQLLADMMGGSTILLVNGESEAISIHTSGGPERAVEESQTQPVIRGPKDSMTENLHTNLSLVRKRLRTPQLRIRVRTFGTYTHTQVAVLHINGIADDSVVREVGERLDRIEMDSILESGYIEEFIQDKSWTPFPTILNTERPDSVAGALLEGQVAILTDGTPFALIVPVTFTKFLQSSEDYYQKYVMASFLRVIRHVSFWVSMLLPSLYIAITTFHQEMLPSTLLISLAAQREGIPFPAFVEALIMEVTFEVLREAGTRMPKVIGPAISIVGALVLGQAAVEAGLVSAAMVIVVSFTAISNFVTPAINMAIASRIIRFGFMLLAATLGMFGIMAGIVVLVIHLAGLKSFGVPYLTPIAPFIASNWKDLFFRFPWPGMKKRPDVISHQNRERQPPDADHGKGGVSA
ncbi:spore germination protein [Paenibacillus hamazuiensis]|uniref:spore germination protein n=1 Tax=Paenibacillus hamazuiensis TaxID=2936508 RepID=UPI00200D45D4|nr:spore germination protein [Paenibacillus hamazuiensis]